MKKLFILFILLQNLLHVTAQKNIHNSNFKNIDNQDISLKDFKGKKLILFVCDAENPDLRQLDALDSLYKTRKDKLAVIVIPVSDFGNTSNESKLKKIFKQERAYQIQFAKVSKASKANGNQQHALLKWVTDKEENKRFNKDITGAGEMFVVGENGKLFARLKKPVPLNGPLMKKILDQTVSDN
jgi:glutathione peroxidase